MVWNMCLQGQEDMGLYTTVFGSTMVSETHCQIDKSVYTHTLLKYSVQGCKYGVLFSSFMFYGTC